MKKANVTLTLNLNLEDKKYIFGDTYISSEAIEAYNEKYGTSHNCNCDVTIDM